MANIFLAWELGSGLGHVVPLIHLAAEFQSRGHRVTVALRDLARAHFFAHLPEVQCVAAVHQACSADHFQRPSTFAHVLHNAGFGQPGQLGAAVDRWCQRFDEFSPDLVVCDHSPTALLAAAACDVPRAAYGTGFCCPPPCEALPNWRSYAQHDDYRLLADERLVLENMNGLLAHYQRPALGTVAALFHQQCTTLLTTFAELDHFGARTDGDYVGIWPSEVLRADTQQREQPAMPDGGRFNFFAYLKPFRQLPALLAGLTAAGLSGIVYVEGMGARLRHMFPGGSIQFADHPVDVAWATKHCETALLHATHATTAQWLLAGVPVLLLPLSLEQQLLAQRVQQLGAGLAVDPRDAIRAVDCVKRLLEFPVPRAAAQRFSTRHSHHSPRNSLHQCAERLAGKLAAPLDCQPKSV